jgi:hypothetical protein
MKAKNERPARWGANIGKLIEAVDEASRNLEALESRRRQRKQDHDSARPLRDCLLEIKKLADALDNEFCRSWIAKLAGVQPMTEKEYYLMRASGCEGYTAKGFGLVEVSDYEVFKHFYYEDDEKRCHINPAEQRPTFEMDPETGKGFIRMSCGRYPEELQAKYLRPEQRAFLAKHLPAILARFRKN